MLLLERFGWLLIKIAPKIAPCFATTGLTIFMLGLSIMYAEVWK